MYETSWASGMLEVSDQRLTNSNDYKKNYWSFSRDNECGFTLIPIAYWPHLTNAATQKIFFSYFHVLKGPESEYEVFKGGYEITIPN